MKIKHKRTNYKKFPAVIILAAILFIAISQLGTTSPMDTRVNSGEIDNSSALEAEIDKNRYATDENCYTIPASLPPDSAAPKAPEDAGNHTGDPQLDALIERISLLESPITGASVSSIDSRLPGAPREYRRGTHQGLDYYDGTCGVPIKAGMPVYAAGPGTIIRIDHDFKEMTYPARQKLLGICRKKDYTPEDILDKLRGRQVWISHENGLVTRYAHLKNVNPGLQVGSRVYRGDQIGTVGNSGTNAAVQNRDDGPHLHFEIWIDGNFLGENLDSSQSRKVLESIH